MDLAPNPTVSVHHGAPNPQPPPTAHTSIPSHPLGLLSGPIRYCLTEPPSCGPQPSRLTGLESIVPGTCSLPGSTASSAAPSDPRIAPDATALLGVRDSLIHQCHVRNEAKQVEDTNLRAPPFAHTRAKPAKSSPFPHLEIWVSSAAGTVRAQFVPLTHISCQALHTQPTYSVVPGSVPHT